MGNLDAKRDWGFAGDYVKAMWLMLQHHKPDDYIVAIGETYSIREFLECELRHAGPRLQATSSSSTNGTCGPSEVDLLLGDPSKAREKLGWTPEYSTQELCRMMVEHDLELARREKYAQGYQTT